MSEHWTKEMEDSMSIPIPFNIHEDELNFEPPDPSGKPNDIQRELEWLIRWANSDELPRIMTAAIALWHHQGANDDSFADCLRTAIIWERG